MQLAHVQFSQVQFSHVQLGAHFSQVQAVWSVGAVVIVVLLGVLVGVQENVRHVLVDQAVARDPAVAETFHEVGLPQHLEMLRDQGLGQAQLLRQLADEPGFHRESLHDGAASRVGQRAEQTSHIQIGGQRPRSLGCHKTILI